MRYVILGKGGHAQALADIYWPCIFVGIDDLVPDGPIIIGVGDIPRRRTLWANWSYAVPDRGVQKMRGAIVYDSAKLGDNVLVNTGAQIDHDCIIGDHCVISPGAILCGNVTLGEACFIGAGAIILQGVTLEPETFVPAGTLVLGQDHFRKPVRMVRSGGGDYIGLGEAIREKEWSDWATHHRLHTNPQSPRDPVGTGFAIHPRADLSEP